MRLTHVFSDFDGTVSIQDTNQTILDRFADQDEWRKIEVEWIQGKITSIECYQRQFALIRATEGELLEYVVRNIEVDPNFPAFSEFCSTAGLPLLILSDGFDVFIKTILRKARLGHLPFLSNRLVFSKGNFDFEFVQLNSRQPHKDWKQGVLEACKELGGKPVFIGNGFSDKGAAISAEVLFAKRNGELARWCQETPIPYVEFNDFGDVTKTLRQYLSI
jgi:2,3-diketo-5-methylthio-1-phosphopentane phosphatase